MIRLLIVEDQAMVRGALSALLSLEPDLEVVGEAANGEEALSLEATLSPDIVLLDIEIPEPGGLEVAELLRQRGSACRVVILTTFDRPGYLRRAMAAGAAGFLLKDAPADALADALRRIARGQRLVDPALAARALEQGTSPLTARETEVLRAAAEGGSVADVARRLHLAEGTVRNHLSTAMQKLDAKNRLEAVVKAARLGWI